MNETAVTVLIPTYKRPEKLKRAINSVVGQTYSSLKIIVCDNASEDDTSEVVHSFMQQDSRVFYYRHTNNIGMNANFNFAVSKVDTPYFCFLSDDDYYFQNFISDAMDGFKNFPEAKFSILEVPMINEGEESVILGRALSPWPKEGAYLKEEAIDMVTSGYHPTITGCVFKSEIKEDFYYDDEMGRISDMPILIAIVAKYPFYLSKKDGLYFIRHNQAIGAVPDWLAWSKLEAYIEKNQSIPSLLRLNIANLLKVRISQMLIEGLEHSQSIGDKEQYKIIRNLLILQSGGKLLIIKTDIKKLMKTVFLKLRTIQRLFN